ncbi:hypothetical protein CC78DRAFT_239244 [Lojkania enalia]|uniref:Uncharacterized protein n=1 Tax=Lojkania enalia TaxID=147567 RepID=A0A9P4NAQ5_9PLEO|nr:hypothetical protein CC78DRAFT_239244 [Didymosphaeria enalia]
MSNQFPNQRFSESSQQEWQEQYQQQNPQPQQQQYGQEYQSHYGTQQSAQQQPFEQPPGLPPRRSATDLALPSGQDRAEQLETMQAYEASKQPSEDDNNQALLEREFPNIDGSLIAAIYGDSKSLSATREMLMELSRDASQNQQ